MNRRFGVIKTSLKRELGNKSTNSLSMTPEHRFFFSQETQARDMSDGNC